jgi:hypothetical protein
MVKHVKFNQLIQVRTTAQIVRSFDHHPFMSLFHLEEENMNLILSYYSKIPNNKIQKMQRSIIVQHIPNAVGKLVMNKHSK